MTITRDDPILRHLRRLTTGRAAARPDGDLLESYLERRDEEAFATLVDRYGPMVLAVCQAVLHRRPDAEDAFQATFLVLARKGGSIRRRDSLGSWLHGVAFRVARKARAAGARRQALEAKAAVTEAVPAADDLSWAEVRATLHAELARLPERFRAPLVLCYLEGLTLEEAARRLGWTAATVKGRLQRGRERLRRRLERRGLGQASWGAAALATQTLAAPVAPTLAEAAVRAAFPIAGLETPATAAATLARGVLGPLVPAKLWGAAGFLLAGIALAGGAVLLPRSPVEDKPAAAAPPAPAPAVRTDRYGDPLPDGSVARLGTVRFSHPDGLNALHFSPDGRTIISDGDGHLCLWDAATGKPLHEFARPNSSLADPTVPLLDGKTMVFLTLNREIRDEVQVWDLAQGKQLRAITLPVFRQTTPHVYPWGALSPDGRLCAVRTSVGGIVAEAQPIRVFDTATGDALCELPNSKDAETFAFAGTGQLVTAGKNQVIDAWDARTGKLVRQFTDDRPVNTLITSADGRWLVTLATPNAFADPLDSEVIHLWDLTRGVKHHTLAPRPNEHWARSVLFSPDGKSLFTSSSRGDMRRLTVWDVASGRRVRELAGIAGWVFAVSSDGNRVALRDGPRFGVLDLTTGRSLSFEEGRHTAGAVATLSPAGDRVVTRGHSSVSTWDAITGRHLDSIELEPNRFNIASAYTLSPNGRYALSFAGDAEHPQALVWDVASHQRLHTLQSPGVGRFLGTFSPDSSLLATWHYQPKMDADLRLWDARTGKEVRAFPETKIGAPHRVMFPADASRLVVAQRFKNDIIAFDVASGKERYAWQLQRPTNYGYSWRALALSPDGTMIACLSGGPIRGDPVPGRVALHEARTGKLLRCWDDSGMGTRRFEEMTFSPDGRLLASSDVNAVHLWEVATGREVCSFRGHVGEIESLAFSADGRRFASASRDNTVLVWDLALALHIASPKAPAPSDKETAAWWDDLAGPDAHRAYAAIWRLAEAPAVSVPFFSGRLKPVTEAQRKEIRQHVADLDSDSFAVREKASQQLRNLGPAAAADLRLVLEKNPSLELRRRVGNLLEDLSGRPMSGEALRMLRAVAVLEQAGTPEARRLLQTLAEGVPGAWLTREAKAACERLAPRTAR